MVVAAMKGSVSVFVLVVGTMWSVDWLDWEYCRYFGTCCVSLSELFCSLVRMLDSSAEVSLTILLSRLVWSHDYHHRQRQYKQSIPKVPNLSTHPSTNRRNRFLLLNDAVVVVAAALVVAALAVAGNHSRLFPLWYYSSHRKWLRPDVTYLHFVPEHGDASFISSSIVHFARDGLYC